MDGVKQLSNLGVLDKLPEGILDCRAADLHTILHDMTLIHLEGEIKEPIFISVLLHGNETTGWEALRLFLKEQMDSSAILSRSISILIGNVKAAALSLRQVEGQRDYNRIWKNDSECAESDLARAVIKEMQARDVFACIDIHNNSGKNPHYACINRLATPYIQLAKLFSDTLVYFLKPDTVLSLAFAEICPSVTVECGRPDDPSGIEHAYGFISGLYNLQNFNEDRIPLDDVDVYHTVASVKLQDGVVIGVDGEYSNIEISPVLDQLNFCELKPGAKIAQVHHMQTSPLIVRNDLGKDVTDRYFSVEDGWLCIASSVMPSMLTLDLDIIRQDCFCYLLEKLDLSQSFSA